MKRRILASAVDSTVHQRWVSDPILGTKKYDSQKSLVRDKVSVRKYGAFKIQSLNKLVCFQGTMLTDNVSVNLAKQNFEPERSKKTTKNPKSSKAVDNEDNFPHIDKREAARNWRHVCANWCRTQGYPLLYEEKQ